MNRSCVGLACGLTLVAGTTALAQQAAHAEHQSSQRSGVQVHAAPASSAPNATNAGSAAKNQNLSAAQLLQQLAGEWKGQVQVRGADGMTSASVITASNRLENGNQRLASCLTGYAFSKPFEGAAIVGLSGSTLSAAWTDTINSNSSNASVSTERCQASSATLSGLTGQGEHSQTVEQSFSMTDRNSYVFEMNSVGENGRRTLLVRLDMTRLPSGQHAEASAKFKDAPMLARLRGAEPSSARASVPTDQ